MSNSRKYGNVHRQLRALTILDLLIQNAGDRFLRGFADEPLLERLRFAATDPVSDPEVKDKCKQLFGQWAVTYKNVNGMGRVASLYKQLPQRKKPAQKQQSKVVRETEQPDEQLGHVTSVSTGDGPSTVLSGPGAASSKSNSKRKSKHKKSRSRAFNLEKEKPEILQTIASSSVASTNLMNALKLVNRETHRVSEDPEVMNRFELCKQLRRQILRYIQHVESEDFLGSLIHANEELITALMAFEVLDKSVDYDSDSDSAEDNHSPSSPVGEHRNFNEDFAGLVLEGPSKPPRPERPTNISFTKSSHGKERALESESEESEPDDDDDDDNPFGDKNAILTPALERPEPTWYVVLISIVYLYCFLTC